VHVEAEHLSTAGRDVEPALDQSWPRHDKTAHVLLWRARLISNAVARVSSFGLAFLPFPFGAILLPREDS
jgi:hypothetical protein